MLTYHPLFLLLNPFKICGAIIGPDFLNIKIIPIMKTLKHIPIFLALLFAGITFTSCSKDNTTTTIGTSITTSALLVQGTWRVTYFYGSGTDGTANYNGYIFTFVNGGSVSIINGSIVYNGSWTTHNDDSQNKLYMNFGVTTSPIVDLAKDWHIVEKTSAKLRMEDVSGGAGGTNYLTIEKL